MIHALLKVAKDRENDPRIALVARELATEYY
jgi:hypothetical protein